MNLFITQPIKPIHWADLNKWDVISWNKTFNSAGRILISLIKYCEILIIIGSFSFAVTIYFSSNLTLVIHHKIPLDRQTPRKLLDNSFPFPVLQISKFSHSSRIINAARKNGKKLKISQKLIKSSVQIIFKVFQKNHLIYVNYPPNK